MKNSDEGTNGAEQLAKHNHLSTISERKLKANRENAQKSTGPKTARGKAFSRQNAIRHGLFVSPTTDFEALYETPQEYEDLLNGLRDQHQPLGRAEEVEVERIAQCYWRLRRASRYENAVNLVARRDLGNRELAEQREYCQERVKEEQAIILQLQSAKKEIEDTGEIAQELKQRIFSLVPGVEGLWSALDKDTQELIQELSISNKRLPKLSPQMRSRVVAMSTIARLTAHFEQVGKRRWTNVLETAIGQHAIPNREALDRLLRYETTIDRSLTRAIDRLERLQRRRGSERIRQETDRIQ
jgi:hypothetical protein